MINVNHHTISEEAILHEMQYHPADTHRGAMVDAAQSLIIGELLRQRAITLGLESAQNINLDDDKQTDILLDKLVDHEVDYPKASEEECQQYYQGNLHKFTTSPLVAARHILLPAKIDDDQARASAAELADIILKALEQGESFEALAAEHSKCESAKLGGQLGQLSKGQTVAEFERQVFSAEQGLIKHPIETRYGFHIVFVEFKEPGKQLPFDMVQQRISDYLNTKVERKAIAQYIKALISDADIEGFEFDIENSPLMQ